MNEKRILTAGMGTLALTFILLSIPILPLGAGNWPIYKGNIYLTGNNDNVPVKNSNLKWLYQAGEKVYNPVVNDGIVYMVGKSRALYAVDEDRGKLLWKVDMNKIARQFYANIRAPGKIKYPLVYGPWLILSDPVAVYCFNKKTGKVIWARTGMRHEEKPAGGRTRALVDGIYGDPVIHNGIIFYGTRKVFAARDITNGHLLWSRGDISTYSGFPFFFDDMILTQSMDFATNSYRVLALDARTGKERWTRTFDRPFKIFSPLVYDGKVYLPHGTSLYALDLISGKGLWRRDYGAYITSNPAFTDEEIILTLNNSSILAVDPASGELKRTLESGEKISPNHVVIGETIYTATAQRRQVGKQELPFARLAARPLDGPDTREWQFEAPFPGAPGQPVASRGIMFMTAGNYLYAVGTDFYPDVIDGGSARYNPYNRELSGEEPKREQDEPAEKQGETRPIRVTLEDEGKPLTGEVEVRKWNKGKLEYSRSYRVTEPDQVIDIPSGDDVELTATVPDYMPKKVIIDGDEKKREINLDPLKKGRSLAVDNIYFEFGRAYLRKESLNILDKLVKLMERNKDLKLEVQGHTDSVGPRDVNMKLSRQRARAVVEYMVKQGISPTRLTSKGIGPDKPLADNETPEGRKKNRRTEFLILEE